MEIQLNNNTVGWFVHLSFTASRLLDTVEPVSRASIVANWQRRYATRHPSYVRDGPSRVFFYNGTYVIVQAIYTENIAIVIFFFYNWFEHSVHASPHPMSFRSRMNSEDPIPKNS